MIITGNWDHGRRTFYKLIDWWIDMVGLVVRMVLIYFKVMRIPVHQCWRSQPTHVDRSRAISASNWAVTSVPSIHRQGPGLPTHHFGPRHNPLCLCPIVYTVRRDLGPDRQWTGRGSRSFPDLPSVWFYLCKYLTRRDCRREVTWSSLLQKLKHDVLCGYMWVPLTY